MNYLFDFAVTFVFLVNTDMEVHNGLETKPLLRRSNSLQLNRTEHKCKKENVESMLLSVGNLDSSAFSKKSRIAEILELCFQPKTKKEFGNILFNFWERLTNCTSMDGDFCEFDGVCMYALDYVYTHDTMPFSAVSRSLFVYDWQTRLALKGTNKNCVIINCDCFLKGLRHFTDFHTNSKSEEMLVNIALSCILAGNLGLALYLVKFGLIEFPSEVNEKCKKMFSMLVEELNTFQHLEENRLENERTSFPLDELLNHIKEKEINISKSILILFILVIAAEYRMYEKFEELLFHFKFFTRNKKDLCLQKLKCVDLFIKAATQSIITFKDIENFTEVFLNPFLTAEVGKSLVETSRKLLGYSHNYYNPRSLKDLARFKVRSSLRNSITMPEAVTQLEIPVALKEFVLFHIEGIWEMLIINHLNLSFDQKLDLPTPEVEDGNGQAIENANEREVVDRNVPHEVEDGIERGVEDGIERRVED